MPLQPGVSLLPHQARVADTARETAAAGDPVRVLKYWKPGAGKGLGSIAAAEAIGEPYSAVVPASLRPTYRGELARFTDRKPGEVPVLSYTQLARGKLPATPTLVLDEATRMTGPSAQAAAAQQAAANARHLFLLTGTPVRNRPEEFAPYLNALSGTTFSEDEFRKRYVRTERSRPGGLYGLLRGWPAEERTTLANADELRNRLAGKVDYFAPDRPTVPMTTEDVHVEFDRPHSELHRGFMGRLPLALRLKLRFNTGLTGNDLQRLRSFLSGPRQLSLSDANVLAKGGPDGAFNRSAKLRRAYVELRKVLDSDPRKKALVWAPYIQAGLEPYSAKLRAEGVPHVVYHGGMSDAERKAAVEAFNSGRARVALLAPAAAEGLTFKGAQLMQVLSGGWHESQTDQVVARGLRHGSHDGLPDDLRYYHVQRFYSRLPLSTKDRLLEGLGFDRSANRLATDDYLAALGKKKRTANEELLDLLKEVGAKKIATTAPSDSPGILLAATGETIVHPLLGHPVTIDRPKGYVKSFPTPTGPVQKAYPVDYGYLHGLVNPDDGEPADVFLGSGGPHYGRFMKGKNLSGVWEPDERKWYAGLTDTELAAVRELFESQSKGLLRDHVSLTGPAAVVSDVRAAADPYVLTERADTDGVPLLRFDLHHNGKNVAYLTSHPATDGGVWLKGMKVDPAYRGRGLGRRLMEHAIARYPGEVLRLRPRPYDDKPLSAEQLTAFYGRLGFVPYDAEGRMVRQPGTQVSVKSATERGPPTIAADLDGTILEKENRRYYTLLDRMEAAADSRESKAAAPSPTVAMLLKAKAHSDAREYAAKAHIVRTLVKQNPESWVVDSWPTPGIVGLTHRSGFRVHLPAAHLYDTPLRNMLVPKSPDQPITMS